MEILSGLEHKAHVNHDRYNIRQSNIASYTEKRLNLGVTSGIINLDLSQCNNFIVVPNAQVTLEVINFPIAQEGGGDHSTIAFSFHLGFFSVQPVIWPTGTDWGKSGVPKLVAGQNFFSFWHQGTSWYASMVWQSA